MIMYQLILSSTGWSKGWETIGFKVVSGGGIAKKDLSFPVLIWAIKLSIKLHFMCLWLHRQNVAFSLVWLFSKKAKAKIKEETNGFVEP